MACLIFSVSQCSVALPFKLCNMYMCFHSLFIKRTVTSLQFMGTWFEVLRTPFIIEYMVKCVRFHCLDKGEENSVGLKVLGERSP